MNEQQVSRLLEKWDELRADDQDVSPEELCRDTPELLPRLKQKIEAIKEVEAKFATAGETTKAYHTDTASLSSSAPTPDLNELGRFRILRELGRGGMGVVYYAYDPRLKRDVAIKVILAGKHVGRDDLGEFVKEAEAVAKFQHPNIVQIFEIDEHDGLPFFVMEFVEGGTLAKRLRESPLPAKDAAALLETVARAIDSAHGKGIVHRDLKPANILLSVARSPSSAAEAVDFQPRAADQEQRTTPKIADFGLAKRLSDDEQTQTGLIKGTPSYMAPEQTLEKSTAITEQTDVYALGAILYECLTGRPPFKGTSLWETLSQVREQEPARPRSMQPSVPRDLETICLKCLHKEPHRRYAGANALADDLQRFQNGKPISARPVGGGERLGKWIKRNPTFAGLIATLALFALAAIGASLWYMKYLSDQAVEHARRADRHQAARKGIAKALDETDDGRQRLHQYLSDHKKLRRLLGHTEEWRNKIAAMRLSLDRAHAFLSDLQGPAPPDLAQRLAALRSLVNSDESDRKLAIRLEQIRLDRAVARNKLRKDFAHLQYREVFRERGLQIESAPVDDAAATIRRSPIRLQLVAALDDWAQVAFLNDKTDVWQRLLKVIEKTAADSWRSRFCDPVVWRNRDALEKLVAKLPAQQLSVQLLDSVGTLLQHHKANAENWLRRAQELHPEDFWINLELGNILDRNGDPRAEGFFRAALSARPNNATAWNNLGITLYDRGDFKEAVFAFERTVHFNPHKAIGWYNLGTARFHHKDLDGSLKALLKAKQIRPKDAETLYNLGLAYYTGGEFKKAIAAYKASLKIDNEQVNAWYNLGFAYQSDKNFPAAFDSFSQAVRLKPDYAAAHVQIGLGYVGGGQLPKASVAFWKALQGDPDYSRAWFYLGESMQAQKNYAAAVVAYELAVNGDDKNSHYWLKLGVALANINKLASAADALTRAVAVAPKYFTAQAALGMVRMNQRRYKDAEDALRLALKFCPKGHRFERTLVRQLQECRRRLAEKKKTKPPTPKEKSDTIKRL